MSAAAASRKKQYPAPDFSKTYTEVPRVKLPAKSAFERWYSRFESEVSLNTQEPWEKAMWLGFTLISLTLSCYGLLSMLLKFSLSALSSAP